MNVKQIRVFVLEIAVKIPSQKTHLGNLSYVIKYFHLLVAVARPVAVHVPRHTGPAQQMLHPHTCLVKMFLANLDETENVE